MIFSSVNLVDPTVAVRATRQLLAQVTGADSRPATRDREQILQALALACLDLDQADPLLLPVTVATEAWRGQDSPSIPGVGNGFIGSRLEALYMPPAVLPENQIPFAVTAVGTIIPQAVIEADLLALIQFPRRPAAAVISTLNGPLFTVNNIGVSNVALSGMGSGPLLDGYAPDNYGICLLTGQTSAADNGLYVFATNGTIYAFTRPSTLSWDWAHQGATFAIQTGATYAGRYVQLSTPDPISIGVTPTAYQTLVSYPSNIEVNECQACIVPRAAAYMAMAIALNHADKNVADRMTVWANQMLARPLPVAGEAHSRRIQTVSRYANA